MELLQAKRCCLIFLIRSQHEYVAAFREGFRAFGVDVEVITIPYFLLSSLTTRRLIGLKRLIKTKTVDSLVVFCSESTELFLKEADYLLLFSAYRTWFDQQTASVIPNIWTPISLPKSVAYLRWSEKPPLRVGFMGRVHSTSRLGRAITRAPKWLQEWLLKGKFLKNPIVVALLNDLGFSPANINTFARIETINVLVAQKPRYAEIELDFVERLAFSGSKAETSAYEDHLRKNTYIICPRGSENFSYRIYEALNFGRIPVIIDTDMVLPREIDWSELAIIIPYSSRDRIYEIITDDYRSRSAQQFVERQQKALCTMSNLNDTRWIKDHCARILQIMRAPAAPAVQKEEPSATS